MRYTKDEKLEIIRLVEGSDLGVNRTLRELGLHKRTFYNWYNRYKEQGEKGLESHPAVRNRIWNEIPPQQKEEVVHLAQLPKTSCPLAL